MSRSGARCDSLDSAVQNGAHTNGSLITQDPGIPGFRASSGPGMQGLGCAQVPGILGMPATWAPVGRGSTRDPGAFGSRVDQGTPGTRANSGRRYFVSLFVLSLCNRSDPPGPKREDVLPMHLVTPPARSLRSVQYNVMPSNYTWGPAAPGIFKMPG